jgi:hypothetical protein
MRTGAVGKPARRVFPGATGVLRIRFVIVYRIGDCERVCLATAPGLSQTARFTVGRLVHGRGAHGPSLEEACTRTQPATDTTHTRIRSKGMPIRKQLEGLFWVKLGGIPFFFDH